MYGKIPNAPIPKNELQVNVFANPKIGLAFWFCENRSRSIFGTGIYNPKRTRSKRNKIFVTFAFKRTNVSDGATKIIIKYMNEVSLNLLLLHVHYLINYLIRVVLIRYFLYLLTQEQFV